VVRGLILWNVVVSDILNVKKREETGTLRMRRLRASGFVPAVLYGEGKESVSLAVQASELNAAIRHGSHILELKGDLSENALLKAVQWDPVSNDVLHLDLARFDAKADVEVDIKIELRGDSPGTKNGGIVKHMLHEVTVACLASELPDALEVSINHLELNDVIHVSDMEVPDGVRVLAEADEIVVTCVEPTVVQDEEAEDAGAAEPEVIGRKPDEEEGGDS